MQKIKKKKSRQTTYTTYITYIHLFFVPISKPLDRTHPTLFHFSSQNHKIQKRIQNLLLSTFIHKKKKNIRIKPFTIQYNISHQTRASHLFSSPPSNYILPLICKIVLHQVSHVSATWLVDKEKNRWGGRMGGLFESALPSPCLIQHVWDALSFHRTRNEWRRSVNVVLVPLLHPFQPLPTRPSSPGGFSSSSSLENRWKFHEDRSLTSPRVLRFLLRRLTAE